MARFLGTLLFDTLLGSDEADTFYGGGSLVAPADLADTVLAGGGDDLLYGNGGADFLLGQRDRDTVYGGVGNDTIYGGSGQMDLFDYADFLSGQAGSDQIYGNAGADTLYGGDGADTLYAGLGNDLIYGGNAYASLGDGADWIAAGAGGDTVLGGEGRDTIFGGTGVSDASDAADVIDGGLGSDVIYGNGGNDSLSGGEGADTLYGGAGADVLEGGAGADVIVGSTADSILGGTGIDRFVLDGSAHLPSGGLFFLDTPATSILHIGDLEQGEVVRITGLGQGRTAQVASDTQGNAVITINGQNFAVLTGVDASEIGNLNSTNGTVDIPLGTPGGGSSNTPPLLADLDAATFLENTANASAQIIDSDVTLTDSSANFDGGNLTIAYSAGGGAQDTLSVRNQGTGAGQIGYAGGVASYEGLDFATVAGGDNGAAGVQLSFDFDTDATPEAVEALIENLTYANSSHAPAATRTISMTVNDGALDSSAVTSVITITAENDTPTAAGISNQSTNESTAWSFALPAGSFTDSDGDALTLTATLANGNPLPGWMSFDATTGTFSGTPTSGDTGTYLLRVTAVDPSAASVFSNFSLTVVNVNDAPVVDNPIANQAATEDAAFSFTFPANSFSDPFPTGDTISYSATLTSGAALPGWLTFNAATRTFSGTPANGDVGTVSVRVTATDSFSATVSDDFDIVVANTNDAPTVANALVDQSATEDSAFSYQFASNSFADVDAGDTLTYSITSALPAWLSFDAATRTFTGTPLNANVGNLDVTVQASDGTATITDTFRITTANTNDAPTVANALVDQSAASSNAFSYTFAANTFNDVDAGDTLTYSVTSSLPAWLSFDAATRTFTGTPAVGDVGNHDITIRATDSSAAYVEDTVRVTVSTPTVTGTAGADTLAGGSGNQEINGLAGNDVLHADSAPTTAQALFEPDNVSGLTLWLDASDQSTLFSDTGGTTQITNGGTVALWNDKSGNNYHATQSSVGNRPTWIAGNQNGLGVLSFDSNDFFSVGSTSNFSFVQNTGIFTVSALVNPSTSASELAIMGNTITSANKGFYLSWNASNGKRADMAVTKGTGVVGYKSSNNNSVPASSWTQILSLGDGVDIDMYINGSISGSSALFSSFSSGNSADILAIGRYLPSNTTGGGLGKYSEIQIFSSSLTTAVRDILAAYQSAKWGIALASTGAVASTPGVFSDGYFVDRNATVNTEVGDLREVLGSVTPTYSITSGNTNNIFGINSSTGKIYVADAAALAADSSASYSLGISAALSSGGAALTLTATIAVQNGNDTLEGGSGNDTLNGSAGNNLLDGGADNDTLYSKGGNDTLIGGTGVDTMTGGGGVDRFTFEAANESPSGTPDTILSFDATADLLVFDGLLSGTFSFVGAHSNAFAGGGNSSARFNDTSDLLEIDTNGDAAADISLTLTGVALADLSAADFLFS